VTGDDYERLGTVDAEHLVTFLGNQAFMRLTGDEGTRRCAALVVDPRAGTFLCSVYERRPTVCRELARGSGACAGERATKASRARIALTVLGRTVTSRS
jgi:hypothetical protein